MPYTLGCSGMHWEPLGDRVRLTSFVAVGVYANHTPILATTHMNNDPGMIPSNYVEVFSYNDTDWNHIGLPMDECIGSGLALALTSAESVRVGFFVSGSSSPNAAGSVFGNVDAGGGHRLAADPLTLLALSAMQASRWTPTMRHMWLTWSSQAGSPSGTTGSPSPLQAAQARLRVASLHRRLRPHRLPRVRQT